MNPASWFHLAETGEFTQPILLSPFEISTGSYDCTAKVFRRDSWELLHNITLHTDSVWDLKIHGDVMATAGLDGTVGVFEIVEPNDDVIVRFILQASLN